MAAEALGDEPLPLVKLHPTVVFSILNSFSRRSDQNSRVIGTLLGVVKEGNTIEILDCFGFPHSESVDGEGVSVVTLDTKMAEVMYNFHKRINKNELIVGWYATTAKGAFITDHTHFIHENFFCKQCENPIHLVVDTSLSGDSVRVKGFLGHQMAVGVGNVFDEIKVEMTFSDAEATCLYHMIKNQCADPWRDSKVLSVIPSEKSRTILAIEKLMGVLDNLQEYVDGVVDGSKTGLTDIGVSIFDSLVGLQGTNSSELEALFQDKSQDLLMVSYLSSLTHTQLELSEKLHAAL